MHTVHTTMKSTFTDEECFNTRKSKITQWLKKIHIRDNALDGQLIQSFKHVLLEILHECNILGHIKLHRRKKLLIIADEKTEFRLSFIQISSIWFYNYTWKKQNLVVIRKNPLIIKLYYDFILKFEPPLFQKIKATNQQAINQYYKLFAGKFSESEFKQLLSLISSSSNPILNFVDNDVNDAVSELAENLIGNRNHLTLDEKEWIYKEARDVITVLKDYDSKESFLKQNICHCLRNNCIHKIIEDMEPKPSKINWQFKGNYYNFRTEDGDVVLREEADKLKESIDLDVAIDFGNSIVNESPLTEKEINSLTVRSLNLDGLEKSFGFCPRYVITALIARTELEEIVDKDYKFVKDTYFLQDKTFVACSNHKHWFGFLVCKSDKTIYYFDSILAFGEDRGLPLQTILLILNAGLQEYITASEVIEQKFLNWKIKNCPVPKQPDRYQCGDNLILNILEVARNYHDVMDIWSKVNSVPVVKIAKDEPNLYDLREFKFATPLKDDQLVLKYRNPNRVRSEFLFKNYRRIQNREFTKSCHSKKPKLKYFVKKIIAENQKISKLCRKQLERMIGRILDDLKKQNLTIEEYKDRNIFKREKGEWPSYGDLLNCFKSVLGKDKCYSYVPIKNSLHLTTSNANKMKEKIDYKVTCDYIVGFKKKEMYWILKQIIDIDKKKDILLMFQEETNQTIFKHKYAVKVDYFDNKNPVGLVLANEINCAFIIDPASAFVSSKSYHFLSNSEVFKSFRFFNVTNMLTINKQKATEIILKNLVLFLDNPVRILQCWKEEEPYILDSLYKIKPLFNSFALNLDYEHLFEEVLNDNYQNKQLYRDLLAIANQSN